MIGLFVGFKSLLLDLFHKSTLCVLSDVAVVVTNHLHKEGLGLILAIVVKHLSVDDADDLLAVLGQLVLDLGLVSGQGITKLSVLRVLFDS